MADTKSARDSLDELTLSMLLHFRTNGPFLIKLLSQEQEGWPKNTVRIYSQDRKTQTMIFSGEVFLKKLKALAGLSEERSRGHFYAYDNMEDVHRVSYKVDVERVDNHTFRLEVFYPPQFLN